MRRIKSKKTGLEERKKSATVDFIGGMERKMKKVVNAAHITLNF